MIKFIKTLIQTSWSDQGWITIGFIGVGWLAVVVMITSLVQQIFG